MKKGKQNGSNKDRGRPRNCNQCYYNCSKFNYKSANWKMNKEIIWKIICQNGYKSRQFVDLFAVDNWVKWQKTRKERESSLKYSRG